jgi:hypothetical protein
MWSQVYLRSGGTELDSVPSYGRFHQQYGFNQLSQQEQYGEVGICGFAGSEIAASSNNLPAMGTIPANGQYTVMHKLHLSLFNSGKLLPTRYAPLEVELSLTNTPGDWLSAAGSQGWEVINIQLMYDAYILDPSVEESFYKALLSNRVLSIPCPNFAQTVHILPNGEPSFSFAAVRAFSRLSHVWLTFRAAGAKSSSFICPTAIVGNEFAAPVLSNIAPTARLSIGPKNYPDGQPNSSVPELFYQFQKAVHGVPNINRDDFLKRAFTIVFDLRRVPGDPTTAISTRSGDLLRVDLQNLTGATPVECWMTLFFFSVCAIRESGVTLLS